MSTGPVINVFHVFNVWRGDDRTGRFADMEFSRVDLSDYDFVGPRSFKFLKKKNVPPVMQMASLLCSFLEISSPVAVEISNSSITAPDFSRAAIRWSVWFVNSIYSSVHQALPLPAEPTGKSHQAKNRDNQYSPHMC